MVIKYINYKDKNIYAIYYRALHKLYYNLDFTGETQLILFMN